MMQLSTGKFLGDNKRIFDAEGVIVSETEYQRKVFEGWHSHENYHLTLILRGGNCERRKGAEIQSTPGKVLFYRRGERHRNDATIHPSKNINLEIEDSFLVRYQVNFPDSTDFALNNADAKFTLLKIYQECHMNAAQASAAIHALALALLHSSYKERMPRKIPAWVNSLREILYDRWSEVLSLTEISQTLGVHPVTISKRFPQVFFCTLGEYTRKIKVEKAIVLLGRPKLSLAEIAQQCGFADQSHFTRTFKAATAFTPNEFRKL